MSEATILVVDDEDDIRHMLCKLLTRAGYAAESAAHGLEAMEQIRSKPIDLVITDILMPEQEGIETIIELRKKHPAIKVIAMSGGGRGEAAHYLDMAQVYGAHQVFNKPFEHSALLEAVEQLLAPDARTV